MIKELRLRRMGGSLGATLPKELVDALRVEAGDKLFAIQTDGGLLLTPHDPTFADAVEAYERISKQYRNALRELAK